MYDAVGIHLVLLNSNFFPHLILVILGPYGLQAILTGQTYKESQQTTGKLLDEWRQFYPVPNSHSDHNTSQSNFQENGSLPPMVEVIVGMLEILIIEFRF